LGFAFIEPFAGPIEAKGRVLSLASENRGVAGSIPALAIASQSGLRLSEKGTTALLGN
jgi:hypothetical protein